MSALEVRTVVGVVIDKDESSWKMLEKLGFERWGYLPGVLDSDRKELGEYYFMEKGSRPYKKN